MWDSLVRQILGQTVKQGRRVPWLSLLPSPTNEEETYVGRMKKDFHIDNYYDALRRYNSDPAYWQQYYQPLPSPDPSRERIRDSIAMAGIPSSSNVFEYGFPGSNPASAQSSAVLLQTGTGTVGPSSGAPPVQFLTPPSATPFGNGVGSWTSSVAPNGPLYVAPPPQPTDQPGGLPGLLQDYLRYNPNP